MTSAAILDALRHHGATVLEAGGTLRLRAPAGTVPADLIEQARRVKPALLELLAEERASDQRDAFEERAAIMEFDGGMPREQAERAARVDITPEPTP